MLDLFYRFYNRLGRYMSKSFIFNERKQQQFRMLTPKRKLLNIVLCFQYRVTGIRNAKSQVRLLV